MTKEPIVGGSATSLIVRLHSFTAYFLLWPALLTIIFILLTPASNYAAIIERFSCHRFDHVAEVQFQIRGTPARWNLRAHGQELWLDLEHSRLNPLLTAASIPVVFPLTRLSLRDFGGGWVRLVFRVRGQVDYVVAQMPHVLIVRIAPSGAAGELEQPPLLQADRRPSQTPLVNARRPLTERTGPNYPTATTPQPVEPVAQRVGPAPWIIPDKTPPIVAIDAGHGGFDPGTESAGGIPEKDVALEIAQRLANALQSRGITAELTRDDDRFLPLSERTELANHAHADLFISIHLNSSPDWSTKGLETYYLNNTSDRATIRLAQMENGGAYGALGQSNLNYILTNLRQDYKAHESSSLARLIETGVAASLETALGIRVNTLGAKMGPFYVLVGAEMPAVLVECGFLSNPREAQLLVEPAYQDALARGMAAAIMQYFGASAAVGNL